MALNIHENFVISQKYQVVEDEKYEPFLCLQSSNLAQTTRHRHRHGNSLEPRRVSPGRIIVVLFWTKHAFLRQINSSICQVNYFSIVFIFVSCKEKGYYRVVLVEFEQLSFDCLWYRGRTGRMHGVDRPYLSLLKDNKIISRLHTTEVSSTWLYYFPAASSLGGTPTWQPHTGLCKFPQNISTNIWHRLKPWKSVFFVLNLLS